MNSRSQNLSVTNLNTTDNTALVPSLEERLKDFWYGHSFNLLSARLCSYVMLKIDE